MDEVKKAMEAMNRVKPEGGLTIDIIQDVGSFIDMNHLKDKILTSHRVCRAYKNFPPIHIHIHKESI